ncbi:MAG: hypothetical protein VX986_07435 [Pseudomonadota bacterium]|nr:hypothetical protein [Pseudomonadota bacterium]
MTGKSYSIIFRKEILPDLEADLVKVNLAKLFKTDQTTIGKMFERENIVIKRGLSIEHAEKYKEAVKKAGALVYLQEETPNLSQGNSDDPISRNGPEAIEAEMIESWTNLVEFQDFVAAEFDISTYSLAEHGERLTEEEIVDGPSFEFTGMVLAPIGETLIDTADFVPAQFKTDGLSLEKKD